jgi:hypothetical protein
LTHREPEHRIWLLHLVLPTRFGRLLSASIILAGLLGFYWAVGIFDSSAPGETSPTVALFFCAILAYVVPVFHFITERTARAFENLVPHLDAEPQTVHAWRHSITQKNRRWLLVNLSLGTVAWVTHGSLLYGSFGAMIGRVSGSMTHFAVVLGTALVWTVMTLVVHALVDNARLFNRLARRVPIDLLDTDYLTAFARVSVISTLAVIGALASFPIMWIDSTANPLVSAPGMIATASPMVFLFLLPIWPVRKAIADAKRVELAGIRSSLEKIRNQRVGVALEDPEGLTRINQLLIYRREIAQVREWPFDVGVVTRLGLYLIIPPLSWVGAALIEDLVEAFL